MAPKINTEAVFDVFQPGLLRGAERLPYAPSKRYFYVEHPTKVILNKENHKWNLVEFTYDPKQGDISMSLEF